MKTLEEIRTQRKENEKTIKELKAKAETARAEWERIPVLERIKYIKETDKSERIMREWEEIEKEIQRREEIGHILRNNYRAALAAIIVPALAEVLTKYDGNRAGKKTMEKIRAEIMTNFCCSFWFTRNILSDKSTMATARELLPGERMPGELIEIYTTAGACFIDEENVIHATDAGTLKVYGIAEHIEYPAARVDEIHAAARKADELRKSLNEEIDKYNALTVDGFKTLNRVYF